jgi:antitoxin component HigA of HigAB toxin-antitoxin module
MTESMQPPLTWITEMNKQAQADHEQYELALRELSVMFDDPPRLGTPEGERFEALISIVEKYENSLILPVRQSCGARSE